MLCILGMTFMNCFCNNGDCLIEGDDRKQKELELREAERKLEMKYASQQIVPVITEYGNAQVRHCLHP